MAYSVLSNLELQAYLKIHNGNGYIDLDKNELRNATIQNLAAAPENAVLGQIYFNSATNRLGICINATTQAWIYPDMAKSVYDTDNDGSVELADEADKLDGQHGSYYLARANQTGTQNAATISDFDEAAQDAIGNTLTDSNSIDFTYNDVEATIAADLKVVTDGGLEIAATGAQIKATGVSQGTYTKVTVNTKGQATAGTTLSSGDLPSHNHTASDVTDFNTAVRTNRLDQMASPTASVSMNSQKITNLGYPDADTDAASKRFILDVVEGLSPKDSVRVGTTTNITLSGTQTIDTVSVIAGDSVLVKNQTSESENGIYTVAAGAWSRRADANTWAEIVGAEVYIEDGSAYKNTKWITTIVQGGTLGTTSIPWTQWGGGADINAGDGLDKSGNTLSVKVDNESIKIVDDVVQSKFATAGALSASSSGQTVKVDDTTIEINGSNQIAVKGAYKNQKVTSTITGDGSTTEFTVTHNIGTTDIIVELYKVTTGTTVFIETQRVDSNNVKFIFSWAPILNEQFKAVIIG